MARNMAARRWVVEMRVVASMRAYEKVGVLDRRLARREGALVREV